MTREDIEKLNVVEPYCFESDREELWYSIGLKYGLEIADNNPKSPWISVDERLPCQNDTYKRMLVTPWYLAVTRRGDFVVAQMIFLQGKWVWMIPPIAHGIDEKYIVYWREIPKLTKEQEDKLL